MFIQPKGRKRITNSRGTATGFVLLGFGALSFLTVIQQYAQKVMPSVRMAQAASAYYGYNGGHSELSPAGDEDEHKIQTIILAQISAIKHKDFATALQCTSITAPDVSPAGYKEFLEARFPQNAAPRSVSFPDGAMLYEQKYAFQRVTVTGQDATTVQEFYLLVQTDEGWRVRRFRVLGEDGFGHANFNPWRDER